MIMSTESSATGLAYPGAPAQAPDTISTAIESYREMKAAEHSALFVRVFGYSGFADRGPAFDLETYDEQAALGSAVADLQAADAAPPPGSRAARQAGFRRRVFAGRNS
jgi:hypothetical protein